MLLTPKQAALVDARRGPRSRQQMVRMMIQDGLRYHEGNRFWQDLWYAVTADIMAEYGEEDFEMARTSPAADAKMGQDIRAARLASIIRILQQELDKRPD